MTLPIFPVSPVIIIVAIMNMVIVTMEAAAVAFTSDSVFSVIAITK